MSDVSFLGEGVEAMVCAAIAKACKETLQAGVPIFYRDYVDETKEGYVME